MSNITATFKTKSAAEDALQKLEDIGVTDEQIGLIVTDETKGKTFNIVKDDKAEEGFATGAAAGGIIGAVWGALASASALTIPGLNVIVTGVWVSTLAGFGAGVASGGLLGGLIGSGLPEHEAKLVETQIKNGAILLAVTPKDSAQSKEIKNILERSDAHNLAA